jgi:hypothetical protein
MAKKTMLQPQQALKSGSMARGRQTKEVQVQAVTQSSVQHAVHVTQQQPHLRACRLQDSGAVCRPSACVPLPEEDVSKSLPQRSCHASREA